MNMYRYVSVSLVGYRSSCSIGMLSCFVSSSDVVKYEFSSICELLGICEYYYE